MKGNEVRTSVIIPVYNAKDYLRACVESVLDQTQKEIEIVLVDDGSTDGSSQMIQYYEGHYSFIKGIYQKNQKLGAARNAGMRAASGQYIYFLDADDYISRDLFEKCYQTAEEEELDFVMFDAVTVVEGRAADFREGSYEEEYDRSGLGIDGKIYSGTEYWDVFFSRQGIFSNAYLFYINAEFLRKNQLYFEPGIFYEDMEWMVRMYACAGKTAYIADKFYFRRIHRDSIMTIQYNDMHMRSCISVCRKLTQMSIDEEDRSKQKMILSVFKIMMGRLREIVEVYYKEGRLKHIQDEILKSCRYMFCIYESIGRKDKGFQVEILLTAGAIERIFQVYKSGAETLNLKLEKYKWKLVEDDMQKFPLNKMGQVVGIYGTGVVCERFLSLYRKYVGEFSASVFFIDTYKEGKRQYHGCMLYNIRDMEDIRVDSIIIASSHYRNEMLENIQKYCSTEPRIFFIPELVNVLWKQ